MSTLPLQAWQELFPQEDLPYDVSLHYSGRFSDYNAHIRKSKGAIEFGLSKKWKGVNTQILIGLLQTLYLRLFKRQKQTLSIDLYTQFIKNLHLAIPKGEAPKDLESSFNRVNEKYFYNALEQPNLAWGFASARRLGFYDFHTDTITITSLLREKSLPLLDYVMYHEMLHKKFKFESKALRHSFHSRAFKDAEKSFENADALEEELETLGRKRRFLFGFSLD